MTRLTDSELATLVSGGESDRLECKESLSGDAPTKLREAICGFANDLPDHRLPGVAIVGLRDDGTPSGLAVTDRLLLQLADMKTDGRIVPPPTLSVEKRIVAGSEVAVVTVWPSDSVPVRFDGRTQVRIGPRRGIASIQDERVLTERRRHRLQPFDLQPVPTSGLADLNLSQFENEYLPQAFAPEILDANERSREERLAATKMTAGTQAPEATVLGLLVIGKSPRDFIPGAYVQFLRIDGTNLSDPIIDSEDIGGTISDVLRRVDDKFKAHSRVAVDLTSRPTEQRSESYPLPALQQIIRNAVMHRTYEATNAPVRVTWFNDRIEIISPGGPFGSVTAQNFGEPGLTDYRNPNLAEAMRVQGFVQRFGVGIATARRLLRDAGHPDLEFTVTDSAVLATVRART